MPTQGLREAGDPLRQEHHSRHLHPGKDRNRRHLYLFSSLLYGGGGGASACGVSGVGVRLMGVNLVGSDIFAPFVHSLWTYRAWKTGQGYVPECVCVVFRGIHTCSLFIFPGTHLFTRGEHLRPVKLRRNLARQRQAAPGAPLGVRDGGYDGRRPTVPAAPDAGACSDNETRTSNKKISSGFLFGTFPSVLWSRAGS